MNTVLSRANSLFAFSLSVMAALTFGCFVTTAFKDRRVPVDIHVSRVMLKNVDDFTGPRERSDLGFITFDLSADLQPIFDWNVKQLFLYMSAEYATKSNALNQVVLWDKIVLRGENTKLNLRDTKSKYFFFDDGNGLRSSRRRQGREGDASADKQDQDRPVTLSSLRPERETDREREEQRRRETNTNTQVVETLKPQT
uniref:Signal peptidase complex subunit 3 n=1 Tax=Labrus bergylta TaxID=56723 RepID=A0A3Q3EXM9_9LABR